MTGQRDIERTLEAWFLDGPSVMPDRVFEAALDRVERVPQRRLAHLRLRLTEMNPRIRIYAVLAAALVIVVAGLALLGGGSNSTPTASPRLAPSPSEPAGPTVGPSLPAALQSIWIGGPRNVTGIAPGAGTAIQFSANAFEMNQSNGRPVARLGSVASAIAPDRMLLQTSTARDGCEADDSGAYVWSLSEGGRTLTITAEGFDECAARGSALPGKWWLMGCENPDNYCLGALDAGSYTTSYFEPFIGVSETWSPRHGVLSYDVPAGWSNIQDFPDYFTLEPPDAPADTGIFLVNNVVAPSDDGPCSELPSTTTGATAEEIATWLANAPGVVATTPAAVSIGGLQGWRLEVSMDPAWTTPCPAFSKGGPGRILFTDPPASEGFAWSLVPGQRDIVYLLDMADGRACLVDISAQTPEALRAFEADATTIVQSFQFEPPAG